MLRGSKKGEHRGGRKKGTPNKVTVEVKTALQLAFQGIGGVPAFTGWARDNQTEFYKLYAKLLPVQVTNPEGEAVLIKIIDLSRGPYGIDKTKAQSIETPALPATAPNG